MRDRCFPKFAEDKSLMWLIAHFEVSFQAALRYPGEVDVCCCVTRLGTKSYVLGHAVFRDTTCIATAKTTTVFCNSATYKSQAIPDELRGHLEDLMPRVS